MKDVSKRVLVIALVLATILSSVCFGALAAPSPKKKSIADASITLASRKGTYNGAKHKVGVVVKLDGVTLTRGTDYIMKGNVTSSSKPGSYSLTVVVTGVGKYEGTKTTTLRYSIIPKTQVISAKQKSFSLNYKLLKNRSLGVNTGLKRVAGDLYVASASKKGFSINQNGKLMIPKGLARGTYQVVIRARKTTYYDVSNPVVLSIVVK